MYVHTICTCVACVSWTAEAVRVPAWRIMDQGDSETHSETQRWNLMRNHGSKYSQRMRKLDGLKKYLQNINDFITESLIMRRDMIFLWKFFFRKSNKYSCNFFHYAIRSFVIVMYFLLSILAFTSSFLQKSFFLRKIERADVSQIWIATRSVIFDARYIMSRARWYVNWLKMGMWRLRSVNKSFSTIDPRDWYIKAGRTLIFFRFVLNWIPSRATNNKYCSIK